MLRHPWSFSSFQGVGSSIQSHGIDSVASPASKGALALLTRIQTLETIKHGVRVNSIGVGAVVTKPLNH